MSPKTVRRRGVSIDWAEARARLQRAIEATEGVLDWTPERARRVMDERARALARVAPHRDRSDEVSVVTFALGTDRCAIEARHLRGVLPVAPIAPVPGVGAFFLGVAALRGEIVAVVDLHGLLGLQRVPIGEHTRLICLGDERVEFAFIADQVFESSSLSLSALAEAPDARAPARILRGVTEDAIVVLDGEALLSDERLRVDHTPHYARE